MAFNREALRVMRHKRTRKKVIGTTGRPRMCIKRSLKHTYAQLVDDVKGATLVAASSLSKEIGEEVKSLKGKISKSKLVGKLIAKKALEKGITTVVFDRSGYEYHGRIQAVAEGAREGGLKL